MEHANLVRRHLEELAGPLREDLDGIVRAIEDAEDELAELRSLRTQVTGMLAKLLPEEFGPKPKVRQQPKGQTVTPEEVANIRTWLEANPPNGDGIWASRLSDDREFREATKVRSGVIAQALAELHEQSFLTLDRMGRGGARIYKVVT